MQLVIVPLQLYDNLRRLLRIIIPISRKCLLLTMRNFTPLTLIKTFKVDYTQQDKFFDAQKLKMVDLVLQTIL
jgi:hypothetical protein